MRPHVVDDRLALGQQLLGVGHGGIVADQGGVGAQVHHIGRCHHVLPPVDDDDQTTSSVDPVRRPAQPGAVRQLDGDLPSDGGRAAGVGRRRAGRRRLPSVRYHDSQEPRTAISRAARSTWPHSSRSEVAVPLGSSASDWSTLTPQPATTAPPSAVGTTSQRTPASLRSPTRTSLGHLTVAVTPTARTASTMASAVSSGIQPQRAGSTSGRTSTLTMTDEYCGADHPRSRRPRPAVCSSATSTDPCGAPDLGQLSQRHVARLQRVDDLQRRPESPAQRPHVAGGAPSRRRTSPGWRPRPVTRPPYRRGGSGRGPVAGRLAGGLPPEPPAP